MGGYYSVDWRGSMYLVGTESVMLCCFGCTTRGPGGITYKAS
jgi:hypothetical protein